MRRLSLTIKQYEIIKSQLKSRKAEKLNKVGKNHCVRDIERELKLVLILTDSLSIERFTKVFYLIKQIKNDLQTILV